MTFLKSKEKEEFSKKYSKHWDFEDCKEYLYKQPVNFLYFLLDLLNKDIINLSVIKKCVEESKYTEPEPTIEIRWKLGQVSSTNMYGNETSLHFNAENEPEFEQLDEILEYAWPELTYLEYKKLLRECCHSTVESVSDDYYSPNVEYSKKKISLVQLFNWVKDNRKFKD